MEPLPNSISGFQDVDETTVTPSGPVQSPNKFRFPYKPGKILPAFWTLAAIFSLVVNVVLIVALLLIGRQVFALKGLLEDQLVGGLYKSFVQMDQANIKTTITVKDTIHVVDQMPVVFDLPLQQNTEVRLVEDTQIDRATIFLNGSPVKLDIILPKGTRLPINLNMTVPVSQTIPVVLTVPVELQVPVDIPLDQTELHQPFASLQNTVSPYNSLLTSLPDHWQETPLCGPLTGWLCNIIFGKQ